MSLFGFTQTHAHYTHVVAKIAYMYPRWSHTHVYLTNLLANTHLIVTNIKRRIKPLRQACTVHFRRTLQLRHTLSFSLIDLKWTYRQATCLCLCRKKHSRVILKIRDSTELYVKKVIKEQCCGAGASGAEIIFGPGAGAGAKNKF